jgi:transcriptional regulator with XRE-family HTH domain
MIREAIKNRRQQLGITQAGLARIVGVRQATISDFERGRHSLSSDTLEKILKELNLNLSGIFTMFLTSLTTILSRIFA